MELPLAQGHQPKRVLDRLAVKYSLKICKILRGVSTNGNQETFWKSLVGGEVARGGSGGLHLFKDCRSRSLSSYRCVSRWTNSGLMVGHGRSSVGRERGGQGVRDVQRFKECNGFVFPGSRTTGHSELNHLVAYTWLSSSSL